MKQSEIKTLKLFNTILFTNFNTWIYHKIVSSSIMFQYYNNVLYDVIIYIKLE